jgi:hypothetical protein
MEDGNKGAQRVPPSGGLNNNPFIDKGLERSILCGRRDLNPHAFWAPPPQDGASANFATSAFRTRTNYGKYLLKVNMNEIEEGAENTEKDKHKDTEVPRCTEDDF